MALITSYYMEPVDTHGLPQRFLRAFAAILAHSNYTLVLDAALRVGAHCNRCSGSCPVYQVSQEPRDVPCARSELLLEVYRRYFTPSGMLRARLLPGGFRLTEAHINRLAEDLYRCTACRRCKAECPMGIDHGLITHLGRWVLAEVGIVPKALRVAVREQLDGATHNTSAIPAVALKDTCEFLEEDCADTRNMRISFPIDQEDAEYIFFPAVMTAALPVSVSGSSR